MNKTLKELALEALCKINNDEAENHEIVLICLPNNEDKTIRICEDHTKNGEILFYLLKLNESGNLFIQYIQGYSPDIPPIGWKNILGDNN